MESKDIIKEASSIARGARANVERAELEQTVSEFERSDITVYRSLARAYRMLQFPFT